MDKSATSIPLIGQWQTETLTLNGLTYYLELLPSSVEFSQKGMMTSLSAQVGCTLGSDL